MAFSRAEATNLLRLTPARLAAADYVLVQSWIGADDELARERLLRLLAALLAESQIVLDGSRKGLLERGHGFALERDHVAQVGDLAMENLGVLVVFDRRLISLVCHHRHGSIPD